MERTLQYTMKQTRDHTQVDLFFGYGWADDKQIGSITGNGDSWGGYDEYSQTIKGSAKTFGEAVGRVIDRWKERNQPTV